MIKSAYLKELPQYHFDRVEFIDAFRNVFTSKEMFELEVACQEHSSLLNFHLYFAEDEFYIIHLPSGTIINWYKHLGRTNTCNKDGFDLDDLQEFLKELKKEMGW